MLAVEISPGRVHGVTPAAQAAFPESDREELEMLATLYAADDALLAMREAGAAQKEMAAAQRGGDSAQSVSLRRIVAVGEVPDTWVRIASASADDAQPPTCMELLRAVPWSKIESIHVDEPGSEALVQRAVNGDAVAFDATGDIELLWYDVTEREALAQELLHPTGEAR